MECMRCGAQWNLKAGKTKLANCPFCGALLPIENTGKKCENITEALQSVADMKGSDFLINRPQQAIGIFKDIIQNGKKEIRLLQLFYENKTQEFFTAGTDMTDGQLNAAVRSLQENVFMDAASARYIVDLFAYILKIRTKEPKFAEKAFSEGQIAEAVRGKSLDMHTAVGGTAPASVQPPQPEQAAFAGRRLTSQKYVRVADLKPGVRVEWKGSEYQVLEIRRLFSYETVNAITDIDVRWIKLKSMKDGSVAITKLMIDKLLPVVGA